MAQPFDVFTSFTGGTLARLIGPHASARSTDDLDAGTAPALIWVHAEAASPAYARLRAGGEAEHAEALDDIAVLAARITHAAAGRPLTLVAGLMPAAPGRGAGLLAHDTRLGDAHLLMRMNLALAEALSDTDNLRVLDTAAWLMAAGANAYAPKQWYVAKIPFSPQVLSAAARDVHAALDALKGGSRKILITDLDDTLWGGVVGDDGIDALRLGGHDHIGEIHADIQEALKSLTRRGVQLAIASKNDEATALAAIDTHPEMRLTRADFAGWAISWDDKAHTIARLMQRLNLGLDAAVFLDDNPIERDRIRHALPQVLVPDLPADKAQWPRLIRDLECFDQISLSAEDRIRTQAYAAERNRRAAADAASSRAAWIASLGIEIDARPLARADTPRTLQLFNKTNQMNLTTRRLTAPELDAWCATPGHELWTCRIRDRFGDAGLTAIIGLSHHHGTTQITDFVMSCRIIGRTIENAVLAVAVGRAAQAGAARLEARLHPTDRNAPCATFFRDLSGFTEHATNRFTWDVGTPYPPPAALSLRVHTDDPAPQKALA